MQTTSEKVEGMDVWLYHGQIYIPNTFSAGATGSKFLTTIRDKTKLTGTRCTACNRVYVPARSVCKDCFAQLKEVVQVSDMGTVLTYTIDSESKPIQPTDAPVVYGIIQLDGADTGFVHIIGGADPEQLRIGMRVKAVFKPKEERIGSVLDINHFKPL